MAAVILVGVADSSSWPWVPGLLPLLMNLVVILALTFVVAEVEWRAMEARQAYEEAMRPPVLSPATVRRLRQAVVDGLPVDGALPPVNGGGEQRLSDEALRGYFLGLHDREMDPGGGDPVA